MFGAQPLPCDRECNFKKASPRENDLLAQFVVDEIVIHRRIDVRKPNQRIVTVASATKRVPSDISTERLRRARQSKRLLLPRIGRQRDAGTGILAKGGVEVEL